MISICLWCYCFFYLHYFISTQNRRCALHPKLRLTYCADSFFSLKRKINTGLERVQCHGQCRRMCSGAGGCGNKMGRKMNWRCFGEVILYVMTSHEKLKQSFIAELDSYFDTASPRRLLWGTIILQEKPKLFSPDMSHRL